MPKSDTWPGSVAMESLTNMDSAGSYDSVISENSASSEDSLEHLSAEERACLMYLEETIESLELEDDSGLSNDEPDSHKPKAKVAHSSTINQIKVADTELHPCHVVPSNMDLGLIPPPSDFMDEPGPPARPEEGAKLPVSASGKGQLTRTDLEELRQKASMKRTPKSSPVTQDTTSKSVDVPDGPKAPAPPSAASPPNHHPETPEPRSPPAVAPKPKKIPSNIIIKSHKISVAGSDSNTGHAVSSTSDRMLLDPQRVRKEALIKLGLLKGDEADSGPTPSPRLTPKSRGAPSSSVSPAAALTSTPPSTPSPALSPVPVPSSILATAPPTGTFIASSAIQVPEILPVPAYFSDAIKPPQFNIEWSSVQDISEPSVNVKTQSNTPPNTPHVVPKHLTPPKVTGMKSATLEHSGMGLSSYMASQESNKVSQGASYDHSLGQLRNSRPRPASLGSGQEFSSVQGAELHPGQPTCKDPNNRKSLPASTVPQATGDSQKIPRSHGISVLISPQAKNGEERRQALKKLGLIRD